MTYEPQGTFVSLTPPNSIRLSAELTRKLGLTEDDRVDVDLEDDSVLIFPEGEKYALTPNGGSTDNMSILVPEIDERYNLENTVRLTPTHLPNTNSIVAKVPEKYRRERDSGLVDRLRSALG